MELGPHMALKLRALWLGYKYIYILLFIKEYYFITSRLGYMLQLKKKNPADLHDLTNMTQETTTVSCSKNFHLTRLCMCN